MEIKKIWAVYFSPTETTKKITTTIAQSLSHKLEAEYNVFDFTLAKARQTEKSFEETDLVVFGMPVIAGRIPNLMLEYVNSIKGNGALAVPIVLFGNRNFDDALIELRDILENDGFHTIAGGAFVGEHSFSTTLGKGRPDSDDLKEAQDFSHAIGEKILKSIPGNKEPVNVDGTPYPYSGYYQPRDRAGNSIDIRKVLPKTDDTCIKCMVCVESCPLGSIDKDDPKVMVGKCMKCCSCVKKCPVGAKHFDDPNFIYHKEELEEEFKRRAQNKTYL